MEGSGLPNVEVFGQSERFSLLKFNSKDSAFVFVLELFVFFLSLKQEIEQEMDNNF